MLRHPRRQPAMLTIVDNEETAGDQGLANASKKSGQRCPGVCAGDADDFAETKSRGAKGQSRFKDAGLHKRYSRSSPFGNLKHRPGWVKTDDAIASERQLSRKAPRPATKVKHQPLLHLE